ncbi:MAG: VanW family protein [Bacteroidota bacterium]
MNPKSPLAEQHNLLSEAKFRLKASLLMGKRQVQNLWAGPARYSDSAQLKDQPIIALSESELWNKDDNEQNWILTAGKVQNLRLAAKKLNGLEIPANQVFSFWKHIGNPNIGKKYVVGREIREGCIIPTIAGGLCQLSNALYDAALKANFEIVERHKHTRVIKGSLAEQDRDATVKWNYVDLRFRSGHAFRIEVGLTADKLVIAFRSTEKNNAFNDDGIRSLMQSSKLNDCYSCGNFQCFKHPDGIPVKRESAITTYILDDKWDEFDEYIKTQATDTDFFIAPLINNRFIKASRYNWWFKNPANARALTLVALQRALLMRWFNKSNIFGLMLRLDKRVAKAAARKIPMASTHLVISQNLLPYLWQEGALGGRTFDVLMTRLPMEKLHERLDLAHSKFPDSTTLNDFRAPQNLIDMENAALTQSRCVITPHTEVAGIFNNKSLKLNWVLPKMAPKIPVPGGRILFPASALGRKGAYELRQLAKELNLQVTITGKATENANFWDGITTSFTTGDIFENISMVIYPVYVEHQPRLLLKAIAAGLPVITTTACGLMPADNLTIVPVGDNNALKKAVVNQINMPVQTKKEAACAG